jgi:Zn-dependent M28 family amino/carboxypeptidase
MLLGVWGYFAMLGMPGDSFKGDLPPLSKAQATLREELEAHVRLLAEEIGARNVGYEEKLHEAEAYLELTLQRMGYDVQKQTFEAHGVDCSNLIVEIGGSAMPEEIVIIGAHYDTCGTSPGADDNASAVAATLALARRMKESKPTRTLRFACFVNEEPPFFTHEGMGSLEYARRCRQRDENIVAMVSLEMLGFYSDEPKSQKYPIPILGWFYPTTGDFIGFVGNVKSRRLVKRVIGAFRSSAQFPSEGAALPGLIPGVGWSDHWAFWQQGYPAIMVTDTAMYRSGLYHTLRDTPDTLDYERMARVVEGLEAVARDLAGAAEREHSE